MGRRVVAEPREESVLVKTACSKAGKRGLAETDASFHHTTEMAVTVRFCGQVTTSMTLRTGPRRQRAVPQTRRGLRTSAVCASRLLRLMTSACRTVPQPNLPSTSDPRCPRTHGQAASREILGLRGPCMTTFSSSTTNWPLLLRILPASRRSPSTKWPRRSQVASCLAAVPARRPEAR